MTGREDESTGNVGAASSLDGRTHVRTKEVYAICCVRGVRVRVSTRVGSWARGCVPTGLRTQHTRTRASAMRYAGGRPRINGPVCVICGRACARVHKYIHLYIYIRIEYTYGRGR